MSCDSTLKIREASCRYYPPPPICRLCDTARQQCGCLLCKCKPGFVLFGPVHSFVRAFDQRSRAGAVLREHRNSNTGRKTWVDDDITYTHVAWRLNPLEDLGCNHRNVLLLTQRSQQV